MGNQVSVSIQLAGILRKEDGIWIAGFPALDLYSQGQSQKAAKENAKQALHLWIESCLDRGTLRDALRALGWSRVSQNSPQPQEEPSDKSRWNASFSVPAYQAAEFLNAEL